MKVSNKIDSVPDGYISEDAAQHILGDMNVSDFLLVAERRVDMVWVQTETGEAPYYRETDVKSAQVSTLAKLMRALFGGSEE